MFERIKCFMQAEDPNGTWLDAEENDTEMNYIYDTIAVWLQDGLEPTSQVMTYISWLGDQLQAK